jgi:hypothetical protein
MYLIQLLLPLADEQKRPFPPDQFESIRKTLTERFGGVTAFFRAPASGLWKDSRNTVSSEQVVMIEVIADDLNKEWWAEYRSELEKLFGQEQLLVWASSITVL